MTDLSSAAQAVWRAHEQVLGDECVLTKTDMKALAAALRAAEKHLSYQLSFEDFGRIDVVDLLAIADELEGAQ
jgi:hypothetical protein